MYTGSKLNGLNGSRPWESPEKIFIQVGVCDIDSIAHGPSYRSLE